jgi:Fe-S cluster assembly protein SufD
MQTAHPFIDTTVARSDALDAAFPLIAPLRRASVARLRQSGIPTGKLETWKYTPIQAFFAAPFGSTAETMAAQHSGEAIPFLTFADAAPIVFHGDKPDLAGLPAIDGLRISTLADPAAAQQAARLNDGIDLARYPLANVNTALLGDGLLIALKAGVDAGSLDLRFASGTAAANVSRIRIELAAGSSLRLIEQHAENQPTNCVIEIALGAAAKFEHVRVLPQSAPPCWYLVSVHVGDDASYSLNGYALGASIRRNDLHVHLDGKRASTAINLACGTHGRDKLDHQIVVEHIGTDTVSRQTIHGIAAGASELTFNGRIHIHPGAQRSDARLTNKNLLADRRARINTKPELEIHANDVKCSHGATVGQIDPAQLFYLRSRGLDEGAARAMLLRAFLSSRVTDAARDAGVEALFADVLAP